MQLEQSLGEFQFIAGFINVVVNPSDKHFFTPTIEDRNLNAFNLDRAVMGQTSIVETKVETDESLMPWEDKRTDTFYSAPHLHQSFSGRVINDTYFELVIHKDPITVTYSRSFNKIDEYLAYVGGLLGFIMVFMFALSYFAEKAYGVSIAGALFNDDDDKPIDSGGFHFLYTFPTALQDYLPSLFCGNKCPKSGEYCKYIEEMDEQLDVAAILKRIMFLENVVSLMLEDHEMDALYLQRRLTVSQAEALRKRRQVHQDLSQHEANSRPVRKESLRLDTNSSEQELQESGPSLERQEVVDST